MGTLHSLSHTADVGFDVEAETLDELFELSVGGLLASLGATAREGERGEAVGGSAPAGASGARTVGGGAAGGGVVGGEESVMELDRPDLERLLVAWLRELLYRATETSSVPRVAALEVTPPEDGPARLEARLRWVPMEGSGPAREIKGVTYHGLDVARGDEGRWHARVVLDV